MFLKTHIYFLVCFFFQHTAVPGLSEPTETVTVETSEIPGEETVIDESGTITIEGAADSPGGGGDPSELMIQNIQSIKGGESKNIDS